MLKKIYWSIFIVIIIASGLSARRWINPVQDFLNGYFYVSAPEQKMPEEPLIEFKTIRDIPSTADLGSFLASFIAKSNNNLDLMTVYLKKVIASDPDNYNLKKELYITEGMTGNITDMITLIKEMDAQNQSLVMAGYVLVVEAMKKGEFEKALILLDQKREKELDFALNPLLKAWNYAALNQEQNAMKALSEIKEKNSQHIRIYHTALISDYFNHPAQAQENYNYFKKEKLPSLSVLISMKEFFERKQFWNEMNPLYARYYAVLADFPVISNVLNQTEPKAIRQPLQGAAESFYMASFYFGGLKMPEVALLLNNIALYLDQDSVISKVWGAELYEMLEMYGEANKMYDRIGYKSDIVSFKQALNFMAVEDNKQALKILMDLEQRNENNLLIQTVLARAYQNVKQYDAAINHYAKAIRLLQGKNLEKEAAQIYFERGVVYLNLNQFDKAEQDMLMSLQLNPDNAEVLNYLGYEWLTRDVNLPEASAFIERANKLTPNKPHILDSLALAYYKQKRYIEALQLAEQAVDKLGASSAANMHLGDIYMALGRVREARSQYKKALDLKMDLTPELKSILEEKIKN